MKIYSRRHQQGTANLGTVARCPQTAAAAWCYIDETGFSSEKPGMLFYPAGIACPHIPAHFTKAAQ